MTGKLTHDSGQSPFVDSVLGNGRGRWLALAAALVASAAMLYAQNTESRCCVQTPVATPTGPSVPTSAPPHLASAPPHLASAPPHVVSPAEASSAPQIASPAEASSAPQIASPAEAKLLGASAPVAGQEFQFELPAGVAPEKGLQVKTIWAARAVSVLFPEITTIGGFRQDALRWHPSGLAIDVMIPNHGTAEGIQLGNQIAGYALANAKRWGVLHVIWRQKIYPGIGAPSWTADYGSETLNHYDHVHIATNGGGYPTGHETYYIGSMTPKPPG